MKRHKNKGSHVTKGHVKFENGGKVEKRDLWAIDHTPEATRKAREAHGALPPEHRENIRASGYTEMGKFKELTLEQAKEASNERPYDPNTNPTAPYKNRRRGAGGGES